MESNGQPQQEASAFANAFNQGAGPMDARQFASQGSGFLAPAGQQGMEQLIGLASADQAALNAGLLQNHEGQGFQRAPSNLGNNQINGQSQEVRRYLEQMGGPPSGHLSRQASEQLSAQSSGHFIQVRHPLHAYIRPSLLLVVMRHTVLSQAHCYGSAVVDCRAG